MFTAANLSRLPLFSSDTTNFCSLAASVDFLNGRMQDVRKQLNSLRANRFCR